MAQLRLPIVGRKPEHLRRPPPPDIVPKAPQAPVVIKTVPNVEDGEKGSYDQLHAELESVLVGLQGNMAHGHAFTKAWATAREKTCQSYGWTADEFYAELDRLRHERWATK